LLKRLILIIALLCAATLPASAQLDIGQIRVDDTPSKTWQQMVKRSDMVVIAWTDSAHRAYPTGNSIQQGKLVNYTQTIQVKKVLKGSATRLLTVVSTGIEPLPDASSPLNVKYPGPLAEGNYLLFLHRVKGTEMYSVTGLWQGVYPLYQDRTVALEGVGFSELNQLSLAELEQKLESATP
jgi:hypothetical protein